MDWKAGPGTGGRLHAHVLQHQLADVGRHHPQPVGMLLGRVKLEGPRAHPIQGLHLDRAGPEGGREEMLGGGAGARGLRTGRGGAVPSPRQPCSAMPRCHHGRHSSSCGLKLPCLSILNRYTETKFKTLESPFPPAAGGSPDVTGSVWLMAALEPSFFSRFSLTSHPVDAGAEASHSLLSCLLLLLLVLASCILGSVWGHV